VREDIRMKVVVVITHSSPPPPPGSSGINDIFVITEYFTYTHYLCERCPIKKMTIFEKHVMLLVLEVFERNVFNVVFAKKITDIFVLVLFS
jgi:hypothetical protein